MYLRELFENVEMNKKSVRILGQMNGKVVRKEKHSINTVLKPTAKKKSIKV